MKDDSVRLDEIKKKVRKLKRLEVKIRFGDTAPAGRVLIWDQFFDLRQPGLNKAKYPLRMLASMSRDEYKRVVDAFFTFVYYEVYKDSGIADFSYDPGVLAGLGLPPDAGGEDVKRRFRELAKKYHPDMGGDAEQFIRLMEEYRKLIGTRTPEET